mgnify:FL=1
MGKRYVKSLAYSLNNISRYQTLCRRIQPLINLAVRWEGIYTPLGLLGNLAFLIGSIFLLWNSLTLAGIWLFILGSMGMFLSSLGGALVQLSFTRSRFK